MDNPFKQHEASRGCLVPYEARKEQSSVGFRVEESPYRSISPSPTIEEFKLPVGLVRKGVGKPHICKWPGWWWRLFKRVCHGDYYYCKCGKIMVWADGRRVEKSRFPPCGWVVPKVFEHYYGLS